MYGKITVVCCKDKEELWLCSQVLACVLVPAAICACLYYGGLRPARLSPLYAVGISMIYAAWVAILRAVLLERHYTVSPGQKNDNTAGVLRYYFSLAKSNGESSSFL